MHPIQSFLVPLDFVGDLVVCLLDLRDSPGPAAQRDVGQVGVDHAGLDSNLVSHLEARDDRSFFRMSHASLLGGTVRPVAGDVGNQALLQGNFLYLSCASSDVHDESIDFLHPDHQAVVHATRQRPMMIELPNLEHNPTGPGLPWKLASCFAFFHVLPAWSLSVRRCQWSVSSTWAVRLNSAKPGASVQMELLQSQFSGDLCHPFRRFLAGQASCLLQEAYRLLPLARSHQSVKLHLPSGIHPRGSGGNPLHMNVCLTHAADQNSPPVVGVMVLLVPDKFINHCVDVIRLQLVPEFWILSFDHFPDVAVALSGSVKADTLVPCDVGEQEGDVCCLGRGNLTELAKKNLCHLLHDFRHLARLGGHGRVISSLSSAHAGDPDLLRLLRQERRRRCLLNLACSDAASLLPPVLSSSPR